MAVLRRRADNVVQLVSYGGIALVVLLIRQDLLAAVIGVPLLVLAARTGRAGVFLGADALVVRNTFRTFRVPWDEVDRVHLDRAGHPALPVVVVRTTNGRTVPLWCLQPSARGKRGQEAQVAVLQQVQQAMRAARPEAS